MCVSEAADPPMTTPRHGVSTELLGRSLGSAKCSRANICSAERLISPLISSGRGRSTQSPELSTESRLLADAGPPEARLPSGDTNTSACNY